MGFAALYVHMAEFVDLPASMFYVSNDIAELTLKHLVQQGKLPADFLFRALDIDSEQREAITVQDVGAAMGLNEPSGHPYLTQELPACVHVPIGGTKSLRQILSEVETDYHRLGTLVGIAEDEGVEDHIAYQAWLSYIKYLDPRKYKILKGIREPGQERGSFSKMYNFINYMGHIVIRDSALLPIYEEPKLIPGHGPVKQGLLRILLQDNHPELAQEPKD